VYLLYQCQPNEKISRECNASAGLPGSAFFPWLFNVDRLLRESLFLHLFCFSEERHARFHFP
jgi:hypothetical protein